MPHITRRTFFAATASACAKVTPPAGASTGATAVDETLRWESPAGAFLPSWGW